MNKTELIAAVAEKAGLTKKDVEKAVALLTLLLQKNTKNNLGFQECRAKQPGIFV